MEPTAKKEDPPLRTRRDRRRLAIGALVLSILGISLNLIDASPAGAATVTQVTNFGSNPGSSEMYIYVPDNMTANAALVVIPNAAFQAYTEYDTEFGWIELADRWKNFAIVFDEHTNNNNFCSANTDSANNRGGTEMVSTMQMIDYMEANYSIDPAKTFMTGLSCGAIWSYYTSAIYPDEIEAVAAVAGVPYRCPNGAEGFSNTCLGEPVNKTPQEWGNLARAQFNWGGAYPRASIWHGTDDSTIKPEWRPEVIDSFTNLHGIDQTVDATTTVGGFTRTSYNNAAGTTLVESWTHPSLGHNYPVDPGTGSTQCGSTSSGFFPLILTKDVNLCAAYHMAGWFGINPDLAPPPPTTTTTTAPTTTTTTAPGGGGTTVTFNNITADDGSLTAYCNGTFPYNTGETYGLFIGRDAYGKCGRGILSFDTASLPDGATVTEAHIVLTLNSYSNNPWSGGNSLVVDVKNGCIGSSCSLQTSDWGASMTTSASASVGSWTSGTTQSTGFDSAGRGAVNRTGKTQLRLRFAADPGFLNYIMIGGGANAQLVVTYQ